MDIKPTKAERVHALVNAGQFPGMSEAFDAHMGSACWVDHAYRQDAATWAAAWKAALAAQAGPAQAPLTDAQIDATMREIGRAIEGRIIDAQVPMHGDWPAYYRAKVRAMLALAATSPASTRPADASISGQAGEFLPLLLRDLCRELEASVPDACAALRDAGLGESGQGSAVTPAMASVLRQRFVAAEEAARDWRMLFDEMQTYTDSLKLELDALRSAAAPQAPAEQPLMLNGLSEAETAQTASVAGLTVAPAEPAAQAVAHTSERHFALREAHEHAAEEAFFGSTDYCVEAES